MDDESLGHLFWYCTVIRRFWVEIVICLWPYIDLSMFSNCENIISFRGYKCDTRDLNKLSIHIIKNVYFYQNKCKNTDVNAIGTIRFIKYMQMVEEGAAVKSSSNIVYIMQKHGKKWESLQGFMA